MGCRVGDSNATLDKLMNKETNLGKVVEKATLIKIAIDMHLKNYRVVRQIDQSTPQPTQKFRPELFFRWLEKQRGLAERVVVCYEAGCFGYEPAREMEAMGIEVYVIAPQNWDEQGKRQVNDQHDAQVMSRRLSEYLCGHGKALSIVRIPTREEEARRAAGRIRDQLRRELRRMQAMGRSLLLQQRMALRGRWWEGTSWQRIIQGAPAWVVALLERWKKAMGPLEEQAEELEAELRAGASGQELLFGEGELTHELLSREMIDAHRFKNARQVGNYFGLCPSESTSDQCRRMGAITKHGNPRLRRLIVELAWRLSRFQPGYRAVRQWGRLLEDPKVPAAVRKKAIVALARRLAVDLWRIATGRVQAEELGLVRKLNASSLLERSLPCP
jgi:transposase